MGATGGKDDIAMIKNLDLHYVGTRFNPGLAPVTDGTSGDDTDFN